MTSQPQDPDVVIRSLIGQIPDGKTVFYQKHMAQHMIPGVPRDWIGECINVFLIRHPARVIASYAAKRENPTLDDIGFRQQVELYNEALARGGRPVVVDSHDIRQNPQDMLEKFCNSIGLVYDPAMLKWPSGGHKDDGIWASHWYSAVWQSTSFAGPEGPLPDVPEHLQDVLSEAMLYYETLKAVKL